MMQRDEIHSYIHSHSLSFKDFEIEKSYIQNYQVSFLKSNRLCLFVAMLFYATFGILDLLFVEGSSQFFQIIRFGITIPIAIGLYFLSFNKKVINHSRILFLIALVVFAFSIFSINVLAPTENSIRYVFGLILLFIFGFNFLKITFWYSSIFLLLIVIGYESFLIVSSKFFQQEFPLITFFVITSYLLNAFSSYVFEYIDRKNFWNQQKLYKTNKEYKELQFMLEQKVSDRTHMLEKVVRELEIAKTKAEENNIIKSSFLATISHEIRTPLTSILGFSQLIARANPNDEKTLKYAETIEKSIADLLEIITNILTLSEIHNNRIEQTSCIITCKKLQIQLENIAKDILEKRNKNLAFEIACNEPFSIEISIGEKELKTIFTQLFDNAVKYTGTGLFGVSCIQKSQELLEFCVYDSGIGINHENLHTIFDFFRQEDQLDTRLYNGIGVGLSICKGIIIKAGGQIWVESEKNKGTKVYITIPILKNE